MTGRVPIYTRVWFMKQIFSISAFSLALLILVGCDKPGDTPIAPYKLSYGDSIFYIKNAVGDVLVTPTEVRAGTYTGFPEGIQINELNGEVNVSKSETGLRYRITFKDAVTGDTSSTIILISGINYYDKIYNLSNNDTTVVPVYNASPSRTIPANSVFDEGNGCNSVGVAVDINAATINIAQSIRNGLFGNVPKNGDTKEVEMKYRVNDGSNKSLNTLKVKLYYFNTAADITPDYIQLIKDREGTILGANTGSNFTGLNFEIVSGAAGTGTTKGVAKPRPPCIFIVGR